MQSQEQTLDSVNEKEKEEENPRGESPLKTKTCVKSDLKTIIEELEKKPKKKATKKITKRKTKVNALQVQEHTSCWTKRQKKKIKEYYRQCQL
ncbi:hypothetical protein EV1_019039 [Malus domestica]|uniref:Uncharacterized protein n=1 Tax=Malus domestica TaxID=3750 RepID=A0A498I1E0_MALDO|nr:hypothetical protein DVH24_039454 [Malus domestica]